MATVAIDPLQLVDPRVFFRNAVVWSAKKNDGLPGEKLSFFFSSLVGEY